MDGFRPGPAGYWTQAWYSTRNAMLNAITGGRRLFLEGKRTSESWHNWTHGERLTIDEGVAPGSEAEIVNRVLAAPKIRCVGSGHSFNKAVRGDKILSLDNFTGIVEGFDHSHVPQERDITYVRVRAGSRVREVTRALQKRGLAIAALASHDAQSIAGVLSTDVHGTGKNTGFFSASVVGLRVIDGRGKAHDVGPDDLLFQAAIGGIGAVGVITEVSLRCVPAFNLRQQSHVMSVDEARERLDELLDSHEHMSLYVFPFAEKVQVHTWNPTQEPVSRFAGIREWGAITFAALGAAWLGDALAWSKKLPRGATRAVGLAKHSDLVMPSAAGFNRSIYHMHQELEFAAPVEQTWEILDRLNEIYESLYQEQRMPYTLLEVRFTPGNGTPGLISPGAGDGDRVWVTLACNQSKGFAEYFEAVEQYLQEIDARPHLGKWLVRFGPEEMERLHGERFDAFCSAIAEFDPQGRFQNDFVAELFGTATDQTESESTT